MKKRFFLLILISGLSLSGIAQDSGGDRQGPGPNGGMLESVHIGYITKRLNLTPEEAQKFWPIYTQYAAEMRQARIAYRQNKNELDFDEATLNIKKKYSVEFGKALSPDRVNQFFKAEKEFGNFVQKEWMQRRQMRQQRRIGGGGQR